MRHISRAEGAGNMPHVNLCFGLQNMYRVLMRLCIITTCFAVVFCAPACKKDDQKGLLGIVVPVGQEHVKKDSPYMITGVYEDSTAYRAGIRPDDRIVQINGVEVEGLEYDYIYNNLLRGPAGTKVTMVIQRKGETLVFDVMRGL
jgi:predicted metalloprotease with PDZ domain